MSNKIEASYALRDVKDFDFGMFEPKLETGKPLQGRFKVQGSVYQEFIEARRVYEILYEQVRACLPKNIRRLQE